jgi:N-carbamoyl-L-amino-acid hydrolase
MRAGAEAAAHRLAAEERVDVAWERLWGIEPVAFDPALIALAERACAEVAGGAQRMPSGALHDCSEVARVVPGAMLFAASTGGVSHAPDEDTPEEDLRTALATFGRWAELALEHVAAAHR